MPSEKKKIEGGISQLSSSENSSAETLSPAAVGEDFIFTGHGDERLHMDFSDPSFPPQDSAPEALHGGVGEDAFIYDDTQDQGASQDLTEADSLTIFDTSVALGDINPVSVESINLDRALDSYLNISAEDVMNMSDQHTLIIDRDSADGLNLEGHWTQGESIDGYTSFTSGGATISIEDTILHDGSVVIA